MENEIEADGSQSRKRARVSETPTIVALQESLGAGEEIRRRKAVEKELRSEIKRLKETVDKQTDTISSLTSSLAYFLTRSND